ncbi:hypothetical protein SAMN05444398_1375 [Roseovarius pacificus]|uniref:Uncharacterized protein n=2 Tax=Roseobacteraceae TaxID=2854170 RepID=A0A1M7KSX1_9RHOB|nr:hypothetical protein GCM10011315_43620 [Roseovarius pacificus]SHM68599.1 hypothetical protein SAMN05444398_1375 [Roseovarius pacificus]
MKGRKIMATPSGGKRQILHLQLCCLGQAPDSLSLQNEGMKTSRNFLSMIKLASVRLWIEFYEPAA